MKRLFTSEAVTIGHPDKVCDQIADAILDELLRQDEHARCACEVTACPDMVHVMGEITADAEWPDPKTETFTYSDGALSSMRTSSGNSMASFRSLSVTVESTESPEEESWMAMPSETAALIP